MSLRAGGVRPTTSHGERTATYDAFISYSHAVDGKLARSLQAGLHRFAKKWYRLRALRVFRDEASLSANPALWTSITQALDATEWFLLLASPEAARSEWVEREAEYWCNHKPRDQLLIVLTGGAVSWDDAAGDFDWEVTNALPDALRGALTEEPRFVDVSWASEANDVSLRNARFAETVADLAAPLHGRPKDELLGEDVREHRRTRRVAGSAVMMLVVFLAAAVVAALVALDQRETARAERDRAEQQARIALSRQLAAESGTAPNDQLDLALLLAAQANEIEHTTQARGALLRALARSPHLAGYLPGTERSTSLVLNSSGTRLLLGREDGTLSTWDLRRYRRDILLELPGASPITATAFSADNRLVAAGREDGEVGVWDARTGRLIAQPSVGSAVRAVAIDEHSTLLAATDDEGLLTLWEVGVDEPLHVLDSGSTFFTTLAFLANKRLVAADGQGRLSIWDIASEPFLVGSDHAGGGQPLTSAFSSDTSLFAAVTLGQQTPYLYDVVQRSFIFETNLVGPSLNLDSLAFSSDGQTLAGAGEGQVILWDTHSGEARDEDLIGVPERAAVSTVGTGGSPEIYRGAVAVAGDVVVAAGERGVVAWDLGAHTLLHTVNLSDATPLDDVPNVVRGAVSVAFSPDGRLLAWTLLSIDRSLEIVVWDLEEGRELMRIPDEKVLGFSPNGTKLAVGGFLEEDFTLVDLASGERRGVSELPWKTRSETPGEPAARRPWVVDSMGIGASIAFDGTVTLWDTERSQPLGTVEVPGAFDPSALVFDPQGRRLAVATSGGALSLIDTDDESWHRAACELVGRALTEEEWNTYVGAGSVFQRSC